MFRMGVGWDLRFGRVLLKLVFRGMGGVGEGMCCD